MAAEPQLDVHLTAAADADATMQTGAPPTACTPPFQGDTAVVAQDHGALYPVTLPDLPGRSMGVAPN